MVEIIEQQKVVDEYKNMPMEGMDLIPLELSLHKYDPVITSQIINIIETDCFRHHKTFESVLSNLWNMWMEGIREFENATMCCTTNAKNNNEMDGVEVIDLCSISQTKQGTWQGKRKYKTTKSRQNEIRHNG